MTVQPVRPTGPFRDEQAAQIELLMSENERLTERNAELTQKVAALKANRPSRLRAFWWKWEVQLGRALWTAFLTALFGGIITLGTFMIASQDHWGDVQKRALSNCLETRAEIECFIENHVLYDEQCCDVDDLFERRAQLDACLQHHSTAVCMRFVE